MERGTILIALVLDLAVGPVRGATMIQPIRCPAVRCCACDTCDGVVDYTGM